MTSEKNDILAVIPTYNNEKTLARVIGDVRRYCTDVLVVNDGSTDSTADILGTAGVEAVSYAPNRGKGYALRRALRYAAEHGYRYMLTIDSDGQHYASDIPKFVEEIAKTPKVDSVVDTPDGEGVVVETSPLAGLCKVSLAKNPASIQLYHRDDLKVKGSAKGRKNPPPQTAQPKDGNTKS